ncbi:hypothetical protein HS088_TW13G01270 [Tripterygium wilfordii]|uniref:RING-type E3 ubiquitin transferase n=2 Tax=Tripterygium wilfordii TaxID=458696 RepID=A0A7J7CW63_TRIWF|nr:putative RING-type E3 ubiquitin transferase C3H69 isoform X2 [Tripterygium wilfordii]KAF5738372.1 hypothetical protein HS088_TW13G01270 [Tripterygium wilfordii]
MCAYGSRCRYEHVKASWLESAASSSSANPRPSLVSNFNPEFLPPKTASNGVTTLPGSPAVTKAFAPRAKPARNSDPTQHTILDHGDVLEPRNVNPVDRPLCSFDAAGNCPRGDTCLHIHGDLCSTCGKHCLHPFRPEEREQHKRTCEKKQKRLEALKHSQEIECSVCMEYVLSKPTVAERKFGLLSECDHPFCISCIRNWRSSSPSSGVDVNSALRTCPICRKLSYFVVPSVIWYSTQEEKQEIVDSYKEKLSSIDCKHFNFGNRNCPFGTSCFYKHTVKPGSYMWKYNRPPPSRRPPRRSNIVDMDELYDVFERMMDDEYLCYAEDFYDGDLTPMEMALLLMHLEIDSDGFSSDEEDVS